MLVLRYILLSILCLASLAAQDQVRVGTALSTANAQRIERYLVGVAPSISVDVQAIDEAVIAARAAALDVEVLFGIDAQILEGLAADRRLQAYKSPKRSGVVPFYADPEHRYLVPFARPWCIAYATDYYTELSSPHELDRLLDPAFTGYIVVSIPEAAPSLYVGLIQRQLLEGHSEERAFGWLTSFDARVREYCDSPLETRSALLRGEGRIGVLPLDLLLDLPGTTTSIAYNLPQQAVPVTGLGLALKKFSGESAAAKTIYDHLLDPAFARLLANEAFLLPSTRTDLNRDDVPGVLRDTAVNLLPYNPNATDMDAWDRRWRDRVRGQGASAEQLDMSLDLIFGLLFLVFIYFVFKHLNRSEI